MWEWRHASGLGPCVGLISASTGTQEEDETPLARQGMRVATPAGGRSVRWLGTRVVCRSARSGRQAPALRFFGYTRASDRGSQLTGHFPTNRSCRLGPAHQGMKIGDLLETFGRHSCQAAATPLDSGFRRNGRIGLREAIPDRSPGHAFVPMTLTRLIALDPAGYDCRCGF